MSSIVLPCGTETSRAAPSNAPSGIAIRSAKPAAARAAWPPQPETFRLQIVTSAIIASGCGRAIAVRFARDGAAVVVSDIADTGGHETVGLIKRDGGRAAYLRADVRDERQVQELIETCKIALSCIVGRHIGRHIDQVAAAQFGGIRRKPDLRTIAGQQIIEPGLHDRQLTGREPCNQSGVPIDGPDLKTFAGGGNGRTKA